MQLGEIYDELDSISPFSLQDEWDNSGLIIGQRELHVQKVVLSLDVDEFLLDSVESNSLIITHHPLIFKGLKRLDFGSYPSNLIQKMVQKNISLISMHTNFDKTHLNRYVCESVFGFEVLSQDGYVCVCKFENNFKNLALHVKSCLGVEKLRVVCTNEKIKTVAVTTGSGGDLIGQINADCFLTGDIKYHQALEAKSNNLNLIDIGHFESEAYFGEVLAPYLKNLSLKVIMSNSKNPFDTI